MKKSIGIWRAVGGGFVGSLIASSAVAVWVVAAFWNWSWFSSSPVAPGQKVFLYFVAPIMLGTATVPVSASLGAGWRRVFGMFAFVSAAACFVWVMGVEDLMEIPWQIAVAVLFAVPGVAVLGAVCRRDSGRDGPVERAVAPLVGVISVGIVFGVVVVLTWGSVWFHAALFVASWVVFPVIAAAVSEYRIGGEE